MRHTRQINDRIAMIRSVPPLARHTPPPVRRSSHGALQCAPKRKHS